MLLVIAALIFAYQFGKQKMGELKYSLLKIEIPEGTPRYIDEQGIQRIVEAYVPNLKSLSVDSLNLDSLETYMERVTAIKKAEVFRKTSGEHLNFTTQLVVRVFQREPIVRVISGNDNYYMDADGVRIDAHYSFAAKVTLVTGAAKEEYVRKDMLPMILFIQNNEFWKAQIKDIKVDSDGELSMTPLLGSQVILFGSPKRYQEKFRNLQALYEQGFSKLGWDRYKTIDLKYKGQVVCTNK